MKRVEQVYFCLHSPFMHSLSANLLPQEMSAMARDKGEREKDLQD